VRAVRSWLAELPPRVILAIGWLLVILYGFPGMMTMDSIQQLQEARARVYTDFHPAVMARIWHYVDKLIAGPFGMYVIQTTLFIAGAYLLFARVMRPRRAAVVTCLFAIFPPVLAPMGVIWKDCLMAGALLCGIAGLLSEKRSHKLWGLAALCLASAVRYNAPGATLPLVVILFVWLPTGDTWKLRLRRYAVALGAWALVTVVALGAGMALTDKQMHPWQSTLALFDTVGTLARVDGTIPDEELRELTAGTGLLVDHDIHAAIRAKYSTIDFEPLIAGDGHLWDVVIAGTEPLPQAKRDAISKMFWTTVTSHPGAWLEHRFATMRPIIALGGPVYSPVMMHRNQYKGILEQTLQLTSKWSPFQTWAQKKVSWVAKKTPLFRPWLYLALSLILLAFCRGQRDVFALLLSGIGLEGTLLLLAPTPDYRYSHWMVITTCIAIVMLVARRARAV
jgi:hypothetical protein